MWSYKAPRAKSIIKQDSSPLAEHSLDTADRPPCQPHPTHSQARDYPGYLPWPLGLKPIETILTPSA
jgi:hypothetical protein